MRALAVLVAFSVTASFVACGGVDPLPPPPPPPPAMPAAPVVNATAPDGTPAATPPAPVLMVAGAPAPEPTGAAPQVRIIAPSRGQIIPAAKADTFVINLDVKNWSVAPASGHVHLLLDGQLATTTSDLKQGLALSALTKHGATPLAEGRHELAAVLTRGNNETLKSKDAFAVTEFNIGRSLPASSETKKPFLIVTKPDAAYEDNDADHVLVDFLAIGAALSDPGATAGNAADAGTKQSIALRLEGPGIEGALTATTTRVVPYYLENLRAGVYTLQIALVGPDGKPLSDAAAGATQTRTITIKRSIRTEEPKAPADASTHDAGAPDAGAHVRDGGLPRIPPPPIKTKPVLEKPKPPAPPIKKR